MLRLYNGSHWELCFSRNGHFVDTHNVAISAQDLISPRASDRVNIRNWFETPASLPALGLRCMFGRLHVCSWLPTVRGSGCSSRGLFISKGCLCESGLIAQIELHSGWQDSFAPRLQSAVSAPGHGVAKHWPGPATIA